MGFFLLAGLALAGCTTDVHFAPHLTTSHPFPAPISLGVYYTTGTLGRVEVYKNKNVSFFGKWRIHVGEALEKEAFSRLRPRVKRLIFCDSPYPGPGIDYVLSFGILDFEWRNARAETVISAVLRGPGGAELLNREYRGTGSIQIQRIVAKEVNASRGLGLTTREAMADAVNKVIEDVTPYLFPEPQAGTAGKGGGDSWVR